MMDDFFYMRQALEEAGKAFAEDEIPVGAVVECQGRIIARAHNLTERLTDVTVEPCVMCAGALGWSQIKRIVFGAADEKRGFLRFSPQALHPRTEVTAGIMEQECARLMKEFFQKKR